MNRLTREIEEIETKLESYGTLHARVIIRGTKDEVTEAAKYLKLRMFTLQKSKEEEVITADYICRRNKNIVITIRG